MGNARESLKRVADAVANANDDDATVLPGGGGSFNPYPGSVVEWDAARGEWWANDLPVAVDAGNTRSTGRRRAPSRTAPRAGSKTPRRRRSGALPCLVFPCLCNDEGIRG